MKRVSVLLICLVICFSQAAFAAEENNVLQTESSSNFVIYSASISTTSSNIICKTSSVLVTPGPQSITMNLQKWNGSSWVTIESWYTSDDSLDIDFGKTYPISSGKYRVTGEHSAGGETRYSYSNSKTI